MITLMASSLMMPDIAAHIGLLLTATLGLCQGDNMNTSHIKPSGREAMSHSMAHQRALKVWFCIASLSFAMTVSMTRFGLSSKIHKFAYWVFLEFQT